MPTYDYKCGKCHDVFEYFQNMTDKPLAKCPKCNGKIRRLVSGGSGLIFKGTGFYKTDYVKPNSKETNEVKTKKNKQICSKLKEDKCKTNKLCKFGISRLK